MSDNLVNGNASEKNVAAVTGTNTGTGPGVLGSSSGGATFQGNPNNSGVLGTSDGAGAGVSGVSDSGPGLSGSSASGHGVQGTAKSANSSGVSGNNNGAGPGVSGTSASGNGVFGSSTGQASGVSGFNTAPPATTPVTIAFGSGVWGDSLNADGVVGVSHSSQHAGVFGISEAGTFGDGPGVRGNSGTGNGVEGSSLKGSGVFGNNSGGGPGVTGIGGSDSPGVVGQGGSGPGVSGTSASGPGVSGNSTGAGDGVFGSSVNGNGVHGSASNGNMSGVMGEHTGGGNAVFGHSVSGNAISGHSDKGNAGFFVGGFSLNGNMVHSGDYSTTGTVTVAKDIVLSGADCAEEFDVGEATEIEPGTVMIIDENGILQPCYKAYDKTVAGVISGAGDYRPGMILDRTNSSNKRMPIALVGKVYCKVDATYAAIDIGDLLTTSTTLGYAMKAGDPLKAFGAVIGKALEGMLKGQNGLIPILVALQ